MELGNFCGETTEGGGDGIEFYLLDCWLCSEVLGVFVDHVIRAEESKGEVLSVESQKR